MPVTSSVTVCSTCRRGLASMKHRGAGVGVDEELERARLRRCSSLAIRTAPSQSDCRTCGSRPGAGAISTSFWWRRWMLQSRSPRWLTAPVPSPTICTSTCRARSIRRSTYTSPLPKLAAASDRHRAQGVGERVGRSRRRACRARRRRRWPSRSPVARRATPGTHGPARRSSDRSCRAAPARRGGRRARGRRSCRRAARASRRPGRRRRDPPRRRRGRTPACSLRKP